MCCRWPERVFEALTDPRQLPRWWGPTGFTLPEVDLDPTVGGRYRFGMQPPDGALFHLTGEFLEVRRPRLLVFTFRWEEPDPDDRETTVRISLDDLDGSTRLTLSHSEFVTASRTTLHRGGWADSLARLRPLVESADIAPGG